MEHPIIFSGPMVRAILDGRKTQTRRMVKGIALDWLAPGMFSPAFVAHPENHLCPYGQPGDRLWVRETWGRCDFPGNDGAFGHVKILYRADGETEYDIGHWRPSIHMPRWASRILLEVTAVRVERVQDISEEGAEAEGCCEELGRQFGLNYLHDYDTLVKQFSLLWNSINAARGYGWDANPWVWVVEFQRLNVSH